MSEAAIQTEWAVAVRVKPESARQPPEPSAPPLTARPAHHPARPRPAPRPAGTSAPHPGASAYRYSPTPGTTNPTTTTGPRSTVIPHAADALAR